MPLPWRESASLILAAGNELKILFLQRAAGGSFSKNRVFPGGVIHPDDFSLKWEGILSKTSQTNALIPPGGARAPCLISKPGRLPAELGFRICAIRETFEESGILLARPRSRTATPAASLSASDLSVWRKDVLKDGSKFFDLCHSHGLQPDVDALKIWSDWLTPLGLESGGKRFDTVFFVAEGDETAMKFELSQEEMVGYQWMSPMEALVASQSAKLRLAPPQVYECSRLAQFSSAKELLRFANHRQQFGCALTFPIRYKCKDGMVAIFPGDDAYPEKPDMLGESLPLTSDQTLAELRSGIKRLHRIETDTQDKLSAFHLNITLRPGHCDPLVANPESSMRPKTSQLTGMFASKASTKLR
ncbi:Nucleoside diphosphate-linked moiety X motif 19 [Hypsibius exemplaris]|uniref:Nucleoside diphosphate-linked moiety X motif 19 n=1 Tax=Hypsibius exemplaris TaxID=2072580 RepID=A0A1W0X432_HYPEX|nr:Nucleoside diphosphate-linked moiety X motif 19 [Hypsibius exemplaris]